LAAAILLEDYPPGELAALAANRENVHSRARRDACAKGVLNTTGQRRRSETMIGIAATRLMLSRLAA
jgi:hypothetical protein